MYIKVKATGSDSLITIPNVTLIKEIQSYIMEAKK